MKSRTNPVLSNINEQTYFEASGETATVAGIFTKTFLSLVVFVAALILTMNIPVLLIISSSLPFLIIGLIITFVLIFKVAKNPASAKTALYFYAIYEGMILASLVLILNIITGQNVGFIAGGIVVIIFLTMLFVYSAFPTFYDKAAPVVSIVMFAAFGILMFNLIASIFGGGIMFASTFDLGFTILMAGLASFSYLRDFRMIDQVVAGNLPKEYEYVAAFGLLTTTIWLYVEILRLISILASRRD